MAFVYSGDKKILLKQSTQSIIIYENQKEKTPKPT